ncbi:hypothetical protein [Streptomyces sp. NPDC000931]|uniref:hypothetical protein n=1 Tax=Streptomyces sp. NPDC000931 TaxID=3154372 RepID=UPI0033314090
MTTTTATTAPAPPAAVEEEHQVRRRRRLSPGRPLPAARLLGPALVLVLWAAASALVREEPAP